MGGWQDSLAEPPYALSSVAAAEPSLLLLFEAPPLGCRTGRGGGQKEPLEFLGVCVCMSEVTVTILLCVRVLYYSNAAHQWPERGEKGGKACLHRLQTAWGIMQERK